MPSSGGVRARLGATAIHSSRGTSKPCATARRRRRRFYRPLRRRCVPRLGRGALVEFISGHVESLSGQRRISFRSIDVYRSGAQIPGGFTATVLTDRYFYGFFCLRAMLFEAHCAAGLRIETPCAHWDAADTTRRRNQKRTSRSNGRDRDTGRLIEITRGDDSYLCRNQ
jgi:hypothetical protein